VILPDANVLIYAFRRDADRHEAFRDWLENALVEETAFGVSELVLSAVVRVTTHPRIFRPPNSVDQALTFAEFLLEQPNTVPITPGTRHWSIFADLCRRTEARGNLVSDAYYAALAIESGAEWITADRDFARFPGLRWRHPLDSSN
jgi:toxin-antitoxin system PIN domain toxin